MKRHDTAAAAIDWLSIAFIWNVTGPINHPAKSSLPIAVLANTATRAHTLHLKISVSVFRLNTCNYIWLSKSKWSTSLILMIHLHIQHNETSMYCVSTNCSRMAGSSVCGAWSHQPPLVSRWPVLRVVYIYLCVLDSPGKNRPVKNLKTLQLRDTSTVRYADFYLESIFFQNSTTL